MYIINPDPYSTPCYRIGPFVTKDLALNASLPENDSIDEYFIKRFGNSNYLYTENGRQAINMALSHYQLQKDDVVTILTTTGNFYISGCVTKEIEQFCKWSRNIESKTKLLLVNHEFGYPYAGLSKLKETYNLPIIEDCANSFFSADEDQEIGTVGDFVIYSFPKIFPIQVGGLLKKNIDDERKTAVPFSSELNRYIRKVLSKYIHSEEEIKAKRLSNYQYLERKFSQLGFPARFLTGTGIIPGVFMFKILSQELDLPGLKKHFYANGIQCSIFYGERTFFIPCHQQLEVADLDYFAEVMKYYISSPGRKSIA